MGKAITQASWVGKAAYELDALTGRGGSWAFRKATEYAREIGNYGLPLSDFDPRATMRRIYGTNDNIAVEAPCTNQPTSFGGVDLEDLVVDVGGSKGRFDLLVITQDQLSLERPTRLSIPHSLANGVRDALSGEDWWVDGVARARPYNDLIIISLAKEGSRKAAVTLVLTRNEAVELHRLLAASAGRANWSRFETRGFWNAKAKRTLRTA